MGALSVGTFGLSGLAKTLEGTGQTGDPEIYGWEAEFDDWALNRVCL